jgi:hypothetical protein
MLPNNVQALSVQTSIKMLLYMLHILYQTWNAVILREKEKT